MPDKPLVRLEVMITGAYQDKNGYPYYTWWITDYITKTTRAGSSGLGTLSENIQIELGKLLTNARHS